MPNTNEATDTDLKVIDEILAEVWGKDNSTKEKNLLSILLIIPSKILIDIDITMVKARNNQKTVAVVRIIYLCE